jgi:hypothetical protein
MLTYKKTDNLELIDYSCADFVGRVPSNSNLHFIILDFTILFSKFSMFVWFLWGNILELWCAAGLVARKLHFIIVRGGDSSDSVAG